MKKQERLDVALMRDIKNNFPHEYYRILGRMEGMKITQSKAERSKQ